MDPVEFVFSQIKGNLRGPGILSKGQSNFRLDDPRPGDVIRMITVDIGRRQSEKATSPGRTEGKKVPFVLPACMSEFWQPLAERPQEFDPHEVDIAGLLLPLDPSLNGRHSGGYQGRRGD